MVQEESDKTFASLSLIDFGWATKDGRYQCEKNMSDRPWFYKSDNDDRIFLKLDETFRRHLKLEEHFMVDWTRHYTEQHICKTIKEISPNLSIRKMVEHPAFTDNKERVRVLSKFYHAKVDDLIRGKTPFNMYFLYDHKPNYDFRPTSKGKRIVNTAMLDLKRALRNEMGGGFKIHATDNIQETRENMEALGMPHEYHQRQFDTLRRIFDVLNFSGLEYVVL